MSARLLRLFCLALMLWTVVPVPLLASATRSGEEATDQAARDVAADCHGGSGTPTDTRGPDHSGCLLLPGSCLSAVLDWVAVTVRSDPRGLAPMPTGLVTSPDDARPGSEPPPPRA